MKKCLFFLVLCLSAYPAGAASIRVEKRHAPERALYFEVEVPATLDEAWAAFTTTEGLATWLWSDVRVNLEPGGDWLVTFPGGSTGGGTIVSFVPKQQLVVAALAPDQFPTVRRERTRAVFEFSEVAPKKTRVTLMQTGWKSGSEWDRAYAYLAEGNAELLGQLLRRFTDGPIDWKASTRAPAPVLITSYLTEAGERVLQHRVDVEAPPSAVWRAFTTSEGLRGFVAPVAAIDFRVGGIWEATYDPKGQIGNPDNIQNEVIAYLPERMLSIRVKRTPPRFPHPDVAKAVWTVIEIADLGGGRSRVTTSMCGWKQGAEWDQIYGFFEAGNTAVSESLRNYLAGLR